MADNVAITAGTGTTIAADDIGGGALAQRVKPVWGPDGTGNDIDVATGKPLPVQLRGSDGTDRSNLLPVSVSSIAAGTNAIGKLAANSGVDIGDVDVTTVGTITPGTAATSLGKAEDAAHSSGDVGVMLLAVRNDAATALAGTTGDYIPLTTDANGKLLVLASIDAATVNTNVTNASDAIASTTNTAAPVVNYGYGYNGATWDRLQVDASKNLKVTSVLDGSIIADDAAFTPATTKVVMAGFQADENSTDSVDEGDGGAARMTLDRKIIMTLQPHTAGGLSVFRSLDMDETEEDVKTSPGCLYKLRVANRTTSVRYVKLYNDTAANVSVGTTAPLDTIVVPAAGTADLATVLTESFGGHGLTFSVALSIAATTGFADNDTGAPGTNDVIISAYYK